MKKTINVAVGGRSFIMDEDAYFALAGYLDSFKASLEPDSSKEVMDEMETRVAEIFDEQLLGRDVVDISIVNTVIARIGMPSGGNSSSKAGEGTSAAGSAPKKLFRDVDDKVIGGVCSGLAAYFNLDTVLVRGIFLVALLCFGTGFWLYIILCIIVPPALTASDKCKMRGIPATADNIRKFSGGR